MDSLPNSKGHLDMSGENTRYMTDVSHTPKNNNDKYISFK